MRLFIGVVTHDRPGMLEFILRYMHIEARQEARDCTELYVFDTGVSHPGDTSVIAAIDGISKDIRPVAYVRLPVQEHDGSVENCNSELGFARGALVDIFMSHPQFTHCLILDDDILVSLNTIVDAVRDLEDLQGMGVETLTLHPFAKRFGPLRYSIGDHVFVNHDFTGDCAWVIPRTTIEKFGNLFGPASGGYANDTWAAIKEASLTNVTRLQPCYEVQHLGVDRLAGSAIYKLAEVKPLWTKQLFQDYLSKRTLHSEVAMLWSSSGMGSLLEYVRKETAMYSEQEPMFDARGNEECSVSDTSEVMAMPKGKLEIAVENLLTGQHELVEVDNLVVNNAKTIMAHLLGGALAADWALARMVFGTGSTTPTETDVSLDIPITPEKAVVVDYPDITSVRFTSTLESNEGNGFPINEAGLYSGSEGIFSRVVFGPLNKTVDFRFVFRWTIYW